MTNPTTFSAIVRLTISLFFIPFLVPTTDIDLDNYPHEIVVPMGGNTFQIAGKAKEEIDNKGVLNWQFSETEFAVYVALSAPKKAFLSLTILPQNGDGKIKVSANGKTVKLPILNAKSGKIPVGLFDFKEGYNKITLKGLDKKGTHFAQITQLILQYEGDTINANFVRDNEGNNFYWGRRGPSVHLNYSMPKEQKFTGFYNELTVLDDPIGSYFMANGFKEGYFGIQVNSKTERRVLFRVESF
jgi:hypothetical protein